MIRATRRLLFFPILTLVACGEALADEPADLVLRGGEVVTMDPDHPSARALAVRGGRVVAVGSVEEMDAYIGPKTRTIELEGKTAIPGFIESHGHFVSLGQSKRILDLTRSSTWEEVIQQVTAATNVAAAGEWIVGRGWHQDKWKHPAEPNVDGYPLHDALSKVSPSNPVLLEHRAGHMLLANAAAMRLSGVTGATRSPPGGEILKTEAGRPIGVFRENAMSLVYRARERSRRGQTATQAREELLEAIQLAGDECLRHGVTSFHDAGAAFAEVDLFRELADAKRLPVRLWVMLSEDNDALARRMAAYRITGYADNFLTVRGVKRLIDGALGTHGAWLREPYDDLPASRGHNTTSIPYLERTAKLALQHDFQLCVHAIGDRANHEVLNLFERVVAPEILMKSRWRIEHVQHLDVADIPRFKRLGVIASMQAIHCTSDSPFVIARLGQRRAATGAYAWRRLLDAGAVIANGTDAPVEPVDPIACFYASVTRQSAPGEAAFFPEQCMTRSEALKSYTRDAAYAGFEESLKGSLAPGKLADIVILSNNLLTVPEKEIPKVVVEKTIVGGIIRFERTQTGKP